MQQSPVPEIAVNGSRYRHQRLDSQNLRCLILDTTASKSGTIAPITQKTIKVASIAALSGGTKGTSSQVALAPMAACVCHIMAERLGVN
jgi:hypothetical protein